MRRALLLGLLLIVMGYCLVIEAKRKEAGAALQSGCDKDSWYDYYLLVLRWPPSSNEAAARRSLLATNLPTTASMSASASYFFTIHGLWPSRTSDANSYPCECHNEPLDLSKIDPQDLKEMRTVWPSILHRVDPEQDAEEFWAHEWTKHGTCCTGFSIGDYFHRTLELRSKFNPLEPLKPLMENGDGKIVRTNETMIKKVLKMAYSVDVTLGCYYSSEDRIQRLSEIAFCLSTPEFQTPLAPGCPNSLVDQRNSEITNCRRDEPILIPNPPVSRNSVS